MLSRLSNYKRQRPGFLKRGISLVQAAKFLNVNQANLIWLYKEEKFLCVEVTEGLWSAQELY